MRRAMLIGLFAILGAAAALALSEGPASAGLVEDTITGITQGQGADNANETKQDSKADASTQQKNVNLPISILSPGSNGGDVHQGNDADTSAKSSNENSTDQDVDQAQQAGSGGHGGAVSQDQDAGNENATDQKSVASASTEQVNVNAPISILSPGSNSGDVHQDNHADTTAKSSNENSTDQDIDQGQKAHVDGAEKDWHGKGHGDSGSVDQGQDAGNSNETTQDSKAVAESSQTNVNAPISILSPGYGNSKCGCGDGGEVHQVNEAGTSAKSSNRNHTDQDVDQDQDAEVEGSKRSGHGGKGHGSGKSGGGGGGSIVQGQDAKNANETEQASNATATSKQVNVNAPISVLSPGSNSGDVEQANQAGTSAKSSNRDHTGQDVDQDQDAEVEGSKSHDHGRKDHGRDKGHGGTGWNKGPKDDGRNGGSVDQDQRAGNANKTRQSSEAAAESEQRNVSFPFLVLSPSAGHGGDVTQGNFADTFAKSWNRNHTGQGIDQRQMALVA